MSKPKVAIERCAISADQAEVNAAVAQAVEAIGGIPQAVRSAKSMVVKPNYVGIMSKGSNDEVRTYKQRQAHNTEPAVCAAAIKLIREANPSATIYYGDGLDIRHAHRTAADIFDYMECNSAGKKVQPVPN